MSKIRNGGLDQYGTEPFEQQQFGTAGVEGVNVICGYLNRYTYNEESDRRIVLGHFMNAACL